MDDRYRLTKKDKTYIDISLAFEPSALNHDITNLYNERAINNSVKNIIMTVPLEQPFNRNFGSKVSDMLFDVVDQSTSGMLYLEIERSIKFCEPRIEIQDISIQVGDDTSPNNIVATIVYKIIGSEKIFEVSEILIPTR